MMTCPKVSNPFPLQLIRSSVALLLRAQQHSVRTHSCTFLGSNLPSTLMHSLAPNCRVPCQSPSCVIGASEVRSPNYISSVVSLVSCPSSNTFSFAIVVVFLKQVLLRKIVFNTGFCLTGCLICRIYNKSSDEIEPGMGEGRLGEA